MNIVNQIIGALVEAWSEVKVQKARVVLSLVGVTAAVAAMSTVIALGDLLVQSQREMQEAWSGREVTLTLSAYRMDPDQGDGLTPTDAVYKESGVSMVCHGEGCAGVPADSSTAAGADTGWSSDATGHVNDPIGSAMLTVADRFQIPYWSRMAQGYGIQVKELMEVYQYGTFQGRAVPAPEYMSDVQVFAVDPAYQVLYRLKPSEGRWLKSGDVNQRVTPVVINSVLWELCGKPPIDQPTTLTFTYPADQQVRIVGVIPSASKWDSPTIYMPYDSWLLMRPAEMQQDSSTASVWVGPNQADEARQVLPAALKAVLGDGWQVDAYGGENWDTGEDMMGTIKLAVMGIGGIVILLGALGLLNVAIVTVRQRIREIGIRRAMGASARRVFFSVFMESVVATFVAGVIGVGIAIVVLRVLPLEDMDILLQDVPAFPMNAAMAGIGIATGVGALCGIIPAIAAVHVKPIDAIRY